MLAHLKNSQKQLRSKRADHVNNVDSPCFLIFILINVIALLWFWLYFVLYLHNSINSLPFKQTSQLSTVSAFPNHGNKENCKLLYKHHLRWRWHQRKWIGWYWEGNVCHHVGAFSMPVRELVELNNQKINNDDKITAIFSL